MLSGAAHWGEISLLSLGLFLGTTDRVTGEIPSPDTQSAVSALQLENQQVNLVPGETTSQWGTYRELPVEIVTDARSALKRLTVGKQSISFESSIDREMIPQVLNNFFSTGSQSASVDRITSSKWTTSDGTVFIENGSTLERVQVRTPRGNFEIESFQSSSGNEMQTEKARRLRGELIDDFYGSLPPASRNEFAEAFARTSLQARIELLSDRMESGVRQYRNLPYVKSLSESNLGLIRQIKSGAIKGEAAETHLQALEKIYSLEFCEIIARSAVPDGNIFRQLLVCRLINQRHDDILRQPVSEDVGRRAAINSFRAEWEKISREKGIADGIMRTGGSTTQFDQRALALEKILASAEERIGLIPSSTLAQTDERISQLVTDLSAGASVKRTTDTWTLRSTDPSLSGCSYEYQHDGCSYIKFERDGEQIIEKWNNGRLISETFLRPGESVRRTNTYEQATGCLIAKGIWSKEGENLELIEYKAFRPDGSCNYRESVQDGRCTFYDRNGVRIADLMHTADHQDFKYRWIFSSSGKAVSTFDIEKLRQPGLSDEKYLKLLAEVLDTPERVHFYLDLCMTYTSDGANDVWQTPSQTINRIEHTTMRGDCEDYAFLARDILRRQGVRAHVIYIPGHAECVWIDKDSVGRYHGRSLGTFGYDQDGVVYLKNESGPVADGFSSAREALQALMKKYEKGGIGLSESLVYNVDPHNVQLADFFGQQTHQIVQGTLSQFVRE